MLGEEIDFIERSIKGVKIIQNKISMQISKKQWAREINRDLFWSCWTGQNFFFNKGGSFDGDRFLELRGFHQYTLKKYRKI